MIEELIKEWADKVRELEGEDLLCEMANFLHSRHKELPSNICLFKARPQKRNRFR